jgi:hypothetical protein
MCLEIMMNLGKTLPMTSTTDERGYIMHVTDFGMQAYRAQHSVCRQPDSTLLGRP